MNRLINTFKYGSWKTRLFFGAILLALVGGAAVVAAAAFAGLGIIPIAVGGAAMVMGIGMSTMVTVVSDENDEENPENALGDGQGGDAGDNAEPGKNPDGGNEPGAGEKPNDGGKAETGKNHDNVDNTEANKSSGNGNSTDQTDNTAIGNKSLALENTGKTAVEKGTANDSAVNGGTTPDSAATNNKTTGNSAGTNRRADGEAPAANELESLEKAVQRIKDSVIYADDGGRYVPDEITEKAVPKASYVMKRVKTTTSLSPSDGPFIDGLPPEKPPFSDEDNSVKSENAKAVKTSNTGINSNTVLKNEVKPDSKNSGDAYGASGREGNQSGEKRQVHEFYAIGRKTAIGKKNPANGMTDTASEVDAEKGSLGSLFGRLFSIFKRNPDNSDPEKEKEISDKKAEKEAKKRHFLQGRKTRAERKKIRRRIKEKTDEYADDLSEKFENELSYADKEKLREEQYAREVENRRSSNSGENPTDRGQRTPVKSGITETEQKKPDRRVVSISGKEPVGDETDSSEPEEEENGGFFKKIGGLFVKLFGNVYDEPEDKENSDSSSGKRMKRDSKSDEDGSFADSKEDRKKKEKKKKAKDKKKDKNKDKADADDDDDNISREEELRRRRDREKDIATGRAEKNPETEEPRRERLPGEEPDVSKYSASNMKKIIKARKLGKDFIPVFIENWGSKHITQTPALCYVKDDHIHFLLLEGDLERDVSVPTDKFINVWYRKNVPVVNLKAYKNIKENMGAYDMFEDVMPSFASSTDQMGGTSYSQNLYLLGNDIALAPPSMRELRKRFRFNTNIFDSLNTRGEYSDYFKKAYENRILWTDNVIGLQEYQRRIRAILQEMVNDDNLLKFEFEDDVAKMVQYRLITDEYADFYLNLKGKK